MKVKTKIQKWGNSLAIRIAGNLRNIPHFEAGMPIEVEVSEEGLLVKKCKQSKRLALPFSEADLLKGMTPKTAHADALATPLPNEYRHRD